MIHPCISSNTAFGCFVRTIPDVTHQQIAFLKELQNRGFSIVAFPLYANYVVVRKGNCGALLAPTASGLFQVFKEPSYLISGNLTARIMRFGKEWFVWKKEMMEATETRRNELKHFAGELSQLLAMDLERLEARG